MRITNHLLLILFLITVGGQALAQLPPVFGETFRKAARGEQLSRYYLTPQRIVWQSDESGKHVKNAQSILTAGTGQADLNKGSYLTLTGSASHTPGIILDFGKEIHGGIEIVTTINNDKKMGRVRIRLGESVSETMSDIDEKGATNDHALRDFTVALPWLGKIEVGNSGFRFARIDLVDSDAKIEIKEISAVLVIRDLPYAGSFRCNDERLNQIWLTGAYTVHLNMQEYLWDGIKRDRLVWVGDMHPEIMTINSVFGNNEVVPKSLDLARDITPLPAWMNGISSYSMWWVLNHHNWYLYQGDLAYLKQQKEYLVKLLGRLASKVDDSGQETLDGTRFLDWPSSENPEAIHAGLQSLMVMTMQAGAELCEALDEPATAALCTETLIRLKKYLPGHNQSKQAAALLALSGLMPADKANHEVLAADGVQRMSTFYGYYMLQARAKAGDYQGAIDNIREYWGAMLDLGATTFWEDFNIRWTTNASRIDEPVPAGKADIHGDFGDYCYQGFRHSFCHGWASGPTSWLSEHVLGIQVLEPGCKTVKIEPHLSGLQWAEGTFPTPHGLIRVKHQKLPDGSIKSLIDAPKGIKIIKK